MEKTLKKNYTPTDKEMVQLKSNLERLSQKGAAPRLTLQTGADGTDSRLVPEHEEQDIGHWLLMESLGLSDNDLLHNAIGHLADLSRFDGEISECRINELLAIVKGIAPRDEVECLLACQMAAIHEATMTTAMQLRDAEYLQTMEYAAKTLPKLAKTYASQMATLKKYRDGGQQKITVQHVNVAEGGQAIVGAVTSRASGGNAKNET